MKIAVADANIFIDLIRIGLIDHLFQIGYQINTTINVVEELHPDQQQKLIPFSRSGQLKVLVQEEFQIPDNISKNTKLSQSDKSIFSLAFRLNALILTGDGIIRKFSVTYDWEVHGILWLFDIFVERLAISPSEAAFKLVELMRHNTRLPTNDCVKRLDLWQ